MRQVPSRCPSCGEPNIHHLDYCAVCGIKFDPDQQVPATKVERKKGLSRDDKIRLKRAKKKKELTELYKKNKITNEQYVAGMKKLGYGSNIDKAMAFKQYIREQVKAFEELKIDPNGVEGGSYYDPNESVTDLPRDEFGNVIIDFTARPSSRSVRPTEDVPTVEYGTGNAGGPAFGESLFGKRRHEPARVKKEVLKVDRIPERRGPKRIRANAIWEDEEEDDFTLDLEDSTSGWWDDEDWELEWTEEDEEDFDEWEIDLDEEEDEDWGLIDEESDLEVSFDEDDEDEEELVLEEDEGYKVAFDEDEEEFELVEDEDEEQWVEPRRRTVGRRNR